MTLNPNSHEATSCLVVLVGVLLLFTLFAPLPPSFHGSNFLRLYFFLNLEAGPLLSFSLGTSSDLLRALTCSFQICLASKSLAVNVAIRSGSLIICCVGDRTFEADEEAGDVMEAGLVEAGANGDVGVEAVNGVPKTGVMTCSCSRSRFAVNVK